MSPLLTVRDRPWSFWGGATLVFFGATMLAVRAFFPGRDRDVAEVVFWIAAAFCVIGAVGCWRGRLARFDSQTKQLVRGSEVVHDLSKARGVVVYPLGDGSPAHYVTLVLGDAELRAGNSVDEVRGQGNHLFPLAQGVPPGAAKRAAIRWRDELDVPVVQVAGAALEL